MNAIETVYLAGPDVFSPNAKQYGHWLKSLCAKHGLKGLFPLDNEVPAGLSPHEKAEWIKNENLDMIRQSTAVLANLKPFRGLEPDSGTAFECGFAEALAKPVWAILDSSDTLLQQVAHTSDGLCPDGMVVEDFDLPRNLMLARSWQGYSIGVEQAVADLAAFLSRRC